uniref:Uncharacterized protein n=1 Tax=Pyxicephalus adspersus TaxID=30357 RepID=A0AAV2ZXZ1_PYXAD|nr:TPA: hypothetical protein GDO54_003732 [Pyxicephalus adspersus]
MYKCYSSSYEILFLIKTREKGNLMKTTEKISPRVPGKSRKWSGGLSVEDLEKTLQVLCLSFLFMIFLVCCFSFTLLLICKIYWWSFRGAYSVTFCFTLL